MGAAWACQFQSLDHNLQETAVQRKSKPSNRNSPRLARKRSDYVWSPQTLLASNAPWHQAFFAAFCFQAETVRLSLDSLTLQFTQFFHTQGGTQSNKKPKLLTLVPSTFWTDQTDLSWHLGYLKNSWQRNIASTQSTTVVRLLFAFSFDLFNPPRSPLLISGENLPCLTWFF